MFDKIIKNPLILSVIAVVFVAAAVFVYFFEKGEINFGGNLSPEDVGKMVVDYINENANLGGNTASLVEVIDESGVYRVTVGITDQEYNSYATKDGKILFPEGYVLKVEEGVTEETSGITKQERPDVKLFIMSYCPFGLQMQKAYLPVYNLLKDKAEMGVYFVDYIMHEKIEIDENLRQYCIQKEEKEKYAGYLSCFTASGDFNQCLAEAGISQAKLQNCTFETDRDFEITSYYNNKETWMQGAYPQFNIHKDFNDQYGIGGSPTVVINDEIVDIDPRSPENFKNIVCQAFETEPEECSQILSSEVPSSGIGGESGSSGAGSCQ